MYLYVSNDPVNWSDPWGLTERDIWAACEFAKQRNSDLLSPTRDKIHIVPETDPDLLHLKTKKPGSAVTDYLNDFIKINQDKYGGELNDKQAGDLLEKVTHEYIHWDFGERGEWLNPKNSDADKTSGYVYDEGRRRTPQQLRDEFNVFRQNFNQ